MKLHTLEVMVLSGLVSTVAARSGSRHEKPKLPPTKVKNFTWSDPFANEAISGFKVACEVERTFAASEFLLHDLYEDEPLGLWPYAGALRKFFIGRPYPGSWDGMDPHQYDRSVLKMAYSALPVEVREWIETQEQTEGKGKGLFAVYEKPQDTKTQAKATADLSLPEKEPKARAQDDKRITIFAPGALYEILPLFVAGDSDCKGQCGIHIAEGRCLC